jgi:hypothetical protein
MLKLYVLWQKIEKGVKVKANRYHLGLYKNAFIGQDALSWTVASGVAASREHAVSVGKQFASTFHLFDDCTRDHELENKMLFYGFLSESCRLIWKVWSELE